MLYTEDEFMRLWKTIEDQKGTHIAEDHTDKFDTGLHMRIEYCGFEAQFDVPYVYYPPESEDAEERIVRVCAVDDRMGLWPRFASAEAKGVGS